MKVAIRYRPQFLKSFEVVMKPHWYSRWKMMANFYKEEEAEAFARKLLTTPHMRRVPPWKHL